MTNILYITHTPPNVGGPTLSLRYLLQHLDRQRFKPMGLFSAPSETARLFDQLNVPLVYLKLPRYIHNDSEILTPIRLRSCALMALSFLPDPRLARILRDLRIDLVHLNTSVLVSAALTCRLLRIPVVWHVRETVPHGLWGIRRTILSSIINRCADAIICISEDEAEPFAGNPGVHIIYNAVDLDQFNPAHTRPDRIRREFGLTADTSVVGYVASITHFKGIYEFVEAAELILQAYQGPVKFMVVGSARPSHRYGRNVWERILNRIGLYVDCQQELERLLAEKGLESHLVLIGERTDTPDLISAMDIVTFPSRLRSIGRAAIEAAALGKPVVATNEGRRTQIVQDKSTGLLVPLRNSKELASAILYLLEHPDKAQRMGQAGYQHARRNFDSRLHAQRVMQVYEQVLSVRKGR